MPQLKDEVVRSIDELIEANVSVRERLRDAERVLKRARKVFAQGASVAETFKVIPSAEPRQAALMDALKSLTAARHRLRVAVIAAGIDEGMSIGELGRAFGVSRQLAARYAKEARGEG